MTDRYAVVGRLGVWWWINRVAGRYPLGSLFCFDNHETAVKVCAELNKAAKGSK